MSGRDLLYKPQVQILPTEETAETKKGDKKAKGTPGARTLGQVGETHTLKPTDPSKAQAYKAAYFNKDISGTKDTNFRQKGVAALRGGEATDLKKVVLPPPVVVENPEPAKLRGAFDLMSPDTGFVAGFDSLLGRQGAWAKGQGVTVESIKQRMEQLEAMIADRRQALLRMAKARGAEALSSPTLAHAVRAASKGFERAKDALAAGTELVREASGAADGLHRRLAKMFGVKMQ